MRPYCAAAKIFRPTSLRTVSSRCTLPSGPAALPGPGSAISDLEDQLSGRDAIVEWDQKPTASLFRDELLRRGNVADLLVLLFKRKPNDLCPDLKPGHALGLVRFEKRPSSLLPRANQRIHDPHGTLDGCRRAANSQRSRRVGETILCRRGSAPVATLPCPERRDANPTALARRRSGSRDLPRTKPGAPRRHQTLLAASWSSWKRARSH